MSVDISAKIEAWDKPSLVAVANDHTRVLLVTAATKQEAARLLANSEEPAQYALMAVLAYLAVRHEIDHLSHLSYSVPSMATQRARRSGNVSVLVF